MLFSSNFERKARSFKSFGMKMAVADGPNSFRPQDMTDLARLPELDIVSIGISCNIQLPQSPSRLETTRVARRTFILGVSGYYSERISQI
jgi:hypothetical protein